MALTPMMQSPPLPPCIDLHLHSTFSDGRCRVETLLRLAAETPGLVAIGLTDHDSANGTGLVRRLRDQAEPGTRASGLRIVEGIEVSVSWRDRVLHLLGYFPPGMLARARELQRLCRENVEANRLESVLRFGPTAALGRLASRRREILGRDTGFDTAGILSEVEASYGRLVEDAARQLGGEPAWPVPPAGRLWREVLDRRGVAPRGVLDCFVARNRRDEAVLAGYWEDQLRGQTGRAPTAGETAAIRRAAREDLGFILNAEQSSIDLVTGAAAIRAAGGLPVLAHPVPSLGLVASTFEKQLDEVAGCGLAGFEAYYPLHTPEDSGRIAAYCGSRNLTLSGGSDFHGQPGARIADLGEGRRVPPLAIVEELAAESSPKSPSP
jgi:predicted metal-dependent phosphoesterase TrpH